jgi:sulfite exporter TauE/SafE
MLDCLLIVMGGLLGSGHCIGMCGGFVLTLASHSPTWRTNMVRQLLFAAGRVSTYVFAGAALGFGSWRLGNDLRAIVNLQALLSLGAGAFLIAEGLFALGWVPRPFAVKGCHGAGGFANLLRAREKSTVFVAGLVNGLLPCGLVYGYLALAASAGHLLRGALVMALFGLGTVPALVLTGLGGGLLSLAWRRRLFQIAAWCMLLTGALAVARGTGFIRPDTASDSACPFCAEDDCDNMKKTTARVEYTAPL